QPIVVVNPFDQFGECNSRGVVQRTICSYGHDRVIALKAGPTDFLPLDDTYLHASPQRNFDRRPANLAVAHSRVPITDIKKRPSHTDREVSRVSDARFRRIHVAAK